MTTIIKAHTSPPVRPFASPTGRIAEQTVSISNPWEEECSALRTELMGLRKQIAEWEIKNKEDIARACEDGRRRGLEEATREEARRCESLEQGIDDALAAWHSRLAEIEGLAALLSRTALAKLFDKPDELSPLVLAAVARQMHNLRRESIVRLRVSAADFPDEANIQKLKAVVPDAAEIVVSPDLEAGACLFDLQLGHVDISPQSQWKDMNALLAELALSDTSA